MVQAKENEKFGVNLTGNMHFYVNAISGLAGKACPVAQTPLLNSY